MHNSITVSFTKDTFTVIAAINLGAIKRIDNISTAEEANEVALKLFKNLKTKGIEVEILELW